MDIIGLLLKFDGIVIIKTVSIEYRPIQVLWFITLLELVQIVNKKLNIDSRKNHREICIHREIILKKVQVNIVDNNVIEFII